MASKKKSTKSFPVYGSMLTASELDKVIKADRKLLPKAAAILTVHRAPDMTKKGRRDIANWLRNCADSLEVYGELYDKKFVARWCYTPRGKKS